MRKPEEIIDYSAGGEAAICKPATVAQFRFPRDARTLSGLLLIAASYIFCWPLIGVLGATSVYLERPFIVTAGGPLVYGFSWILLSGGIYLAGKRYADIFSLWLRGIAARVLKTG